MHIQWAKFGVLGHRYFMGTDHEKSSGTFAVSGQHHHKSRIVFLKATGDPIGRVWVTPEGAEDKNDILAPLERHQLIKQFIVIWAINIPRIKQDICIHRFGQGIRRRYNSLFHGFSLAAQLYLSCI